MPGGLKENVYWFCGEEVFIRQIEGEKHAYHFLEEYKKRVLTGKELPFMIDALNCSQGCIYGTGIEQEKAETDDILYALQAIKEASKSNKRSSAWARKASPRQRLKDLTGSLHALISGILSVNTLINQKEIKYRNQLHQNSIIFLQR